VVFERIRKHGGYVYWWKLSDFLKPDKDRNLTGKLYIQVAYNWGHPANAVLTPDVANTKFSAFLHRFQWLDDALIEALPETWNWLEDWNEKPANGHPNVVHLTRGGPWFDKWQDVDCGDLWSAEEAAYRSALQISL